MAVVGGSEVLGFNLCWIEADVAAHHEAVEIDEQGAFILGDLFHWPRDNANRMLVQLLQLFSGTVLGIAGNHDCKENELGPDDALSVLSAAGLTASCSALAAAL